MNQWRNACWMKTRGHEVVVLCLQDSPIYQKSLASGLEVLAIRRHRKYYDYAAGIALSKLIRSAKISHLILRDTRDMSVSAIAKMVSFRHPFHLSYFMEMQLGVSKRNVLHTLRFSQLDLWSCPLVWLQQQVITHTRVDFSKTTVIPSGLELAPFQVNQSQESARKLMELPVNRKIIGLIGRFDPHKGQLLLLEALKQCKAESISICLLGEPTRNEGTAYFDQIQEMIRANHWEEIVFIRPFREDIPSFYHAIDVFVMASKAETFGMVTIEAMASGIPTIGSNAGGTPELLKQGKLGYLFTPLDATDLAKSIQTFLEAPNRFEAKILQSAAQVFDHHSVCLQVEEALGL